MDNPVERTQTPVTALNGAGLWVDTPRTWGGQPAAVRVIRAIEAETGIDATVLVGPMRNKHLHRARQIGYYMLRHDWNMLDAEIAQHFNRDRTTISAAVTEAEQPAMRSSKDFAGLLHNCRQRIQLPRVQPPGMIEEALDWLRLAAMNCQGLTSDELREMLRCRTMNATPSDTSDGCR